MAAVKGGIDIASFASTQLSLLAAELQCEIDETSAAAAAHSPAALQRAGLAVANLVLGSRRTGLGGRTVLELVADPATAAAGDGEGQLPEHGLRAGDIVRIADQKAAAKSTKKKYAKGGGGAGGGGSSGGAKAVVVRVRQPGRLGGPWTRTTRTPTTALPAACGLSSWPTRSLISGEHVLPQSTTSRSPVC